MVQTHGRAEASLLAPAFRRFGRAHQRAILTGIVLSEAESWFGVVLSAERGGPDYETVERHVPGGEGGRGGPSAMSCFE